MNIVELKQEEALLVSGGGFIKDVFGIVGAGVGTTFFVFYNTPKKPDKLDGGFFKGVQVVEYLEKAALMFVATLKSPFHRKRAFLYFSSACAASFAVSFLLRFVLG